MLCVEGRAKAVLENYEAEQNGTLGFNELVAKLHETFDNTSSREAKMTIFESRIQQVGESEEEYMTELTKLYRNANPGIDVNVLDTAVKRKFLQGISPGLRRNVFIFCNNPYDMLITRETLLSAARKAKDLLQTEKCSDEGRASIGAASDQSCPGHSQFY